MAAIWLISDTHFSHENTWAKFKRPDGTPMRHFTSTKEMDEYMIERWNSVVRDHDHVYHLGDVAMARPALQLVKRLNGKKRLVLGNHDNFAISSYAEVGFQKFFSSRQIGGLLLTHVPVHPDSIGKSLGNVHGHIHTNAGNYGHRYLNVSVEVIAYTPITLEEARLALEAQARDHERKVHACISSL